MNFKEYFGMHEEDVKQTCIICQNYDLPLFSDKVNNGFFIKSANISGATIVALKNNFLAGDTVLYLKETKCKSILLFGSCGGCGDIESGDLVMIDKSYNFESFSKMLNNDTNPDFLQSSKTLVDKFYQQNHYEDLIKTNSACVSSLFLESKYINWFKDNNVLAIDMESSIVFAAAKEIGIQAACFMYVADHIEKNQIGDTLEIKTKSLISNSRKNLSQMIIRFLK